ncbi:MAG: O-antigen ligase family protein [Chloroflexi bacterium]|nr:O-antigen ligase family protein [Chloroflexota bacterium]
MTTTMASSPAENTGTSTVRPGQSSRSDLLAAVELVVCVGAAPLLIFPGRYSPLALALLPLVWLTRLIVRRRALRRTPADWPLLGLLLMTSVSLYPSVDLTLSRPKLYGLILGFSLFSLLVEHLRGAGRQRLLKILLVLGGVGVAAIGLVGTNWAASKFAPLGPMYARLPRLIPEVQTSVGTLHGGIHPNEVGGTLALLLPCALGIALFSRRTTARVPLGIAALAMLGALALTVSRSALVGLAVASLFLAILRWPRLAIVLPFLALGGGGAIWSLGSDRVANWLLAVETATGNATSYGRLEIWQRAWYMIEDFTLTGIGLNTFPIVADVLYPLFLHGPDARVPHAHNLFLQVAVDLGIPGLLSFLGLLAAVGTSLVRAWRISTREERGLVAGLAAGLLGYLIFGLTDAVTLGAKPGVFLWAMLGGAVALGARVSKTGVLPWAHWALFTLACGLGVFIVATGIRMFP